MITLTETKILATKILTDLYTLEDFTNYEIKKISKCIKIMQELDLDKEYRNHIKHNRRVK